MRKICLSIALAILISTSSFYGLSSAPPKNLGEIFITSGINTIFNIDGWKLKSNPADKGPSGAPNPIIFSLGVGYNFVFLNNFAISPYLSFFGNYYLWEEGGAFPAEIERRTALVLNFIFDLPFVYYLRIDNFYLSAGIGVAVNLRFAILAQGVPEGEKDDVKNIFGSFWNDLNFLYPSVQLNFDFLTSRSIGVGLGARIYFPVGSWIRGMSFFHGGSVAAFFRMTFPELKTLRKR